MNAAKIDRVVYKDEGDFGFITTLRQGEPLHGLAVPFDPDRVRNFGTLAEAEALAREHGAELIQT